MEQFRTVPIESGVDVRGVFCVGAFDIPGEAVWIVHAFVKKTEKTPLREINLAKKRIKEMEDE